MKTFEKIIENKKNVLLIFDHGLGDMVLFLPVYHELKKQMGKRIDLASPIRRQFHLIDPCIVPIQENDTFLREKYDYIYRVRYPDSKNSLIPTEYNDDPPKPYLCALYEFGMKPFIWRAIRKENPLYNKESKRVGFHFFGHTSFETKFCPKDVAETMWEETIKAGYEPFEIHMRPQYFVSMLPNQFEVDSFKYATKENSLRFEYPDLSLMIQEICKCRFFFGVDSGPLYLSSMFLGLENIVGLQNMKYISHFLPTPIQNVSVRQFDKNRFLRILERLEEQY